MILEYIRFILSCVGIYGFYLNNSILLIIGTLSTFFKLILGIRSSELKSLYITYAVIITATIISAIFRLNIANCMLVALCFQNTLDFILGTVWLFVFSGISKFNIENY